MKFKISIIFVIVLLLLSVGTQAVVAGGNSASASANVSVTIISLTQELNYEDPVIFETSRAVYTSENGKTAMKLEDAGSISINTNIPWKVYANAITTEEIEVYIRISNDGERNWLPVDDSPVLASSAPGEFYFTWDIMVVGDDLETLKDFEIKFDLQAR